MAQFFSIHPDSPQPRLVRQACDILRDGGVIALPTDSVYSLACQLGDAEAIARIRTIRALDDDHRLALICRDLSEISTYAKVDNSQFRLLKALTPGPYTFILEGSRELPRRILHPKRKTIGLRVPNHPLTQAILAELGGPLLTSTLILAGEELPLCEAEAIRETLEKRVDLVIDSGHSGLEMTTVVDLTGAIPELVRAGLGPLEPLGLT